MDDIENQDAVLKTLEGMDGIRNIRNAQTETDILLKLNSGVKIVGGIVILALVAISIVIIMNTIKISVFTRRTEISIMKYVGATDVYKRQVHSCFGGCCQQLFLQELHFHLLVFCNLWENLAFRQQ